MKDKLEAYLQYLRREERSRATRQQYRRDILRFLAFLGESQLTKEQVIEYKERLQRVYQPASVNAKLVAVNGFLTFLGQPQLRVRQLKIQKKPYCPQEKELSREEYRRLVTAAQKKGTKGWPCWCRQFARRAFGYPSCGLLRPRQWRREKPKSA